MPDNATPQVSVRLDAELRTMAADLQDALATPLRPAVSLADVIRAAIRATHGQFVTCRQRPVMPAGQLA